MDINLLRKRKIKILSEILRKSWHFFAGLALIMGYSMMMMHFSREIALMALVVVLLAVMEFEHIRIEYRPKLLKVIDVLFRKKELDNVSSLIPFVTAGIIVFAVFDYWIAFTAMLMLIIGDSFSAGFGMVFGRKKLRKSKTYIGTFAGLVANLLTGFVIMYEYPFIFIPMALTATIIELLTNKLEDNLTVPISAAFAGYVMTLILGITFIAI